MTSLTLGVDPGKQGAPAAPIVVGLDLSIAATGVCWRASERAPVKVETWKGKPADGDSRLEVIATTVADLVDDDTDLVVIEDLPTHARSAGITGMVHGAVRVELIRAGVPYALVSPATLKTFATGRGNADKTAMALAAYKRAGVEFSDDNECDAWWLWVAGMVRLGAGPLELPARQIAALDKARWPEVGR